MSTYLTKILSKEPVLSWVGSCLTLNQLCFPVWFLNKLPSVVVTSNVCKSYQLSALGEPPSAKLPCITTCPS